MVFTSKDRWEKQLASALGPKYYRVASQTLQAIHLIVFAHQALKPVINDIQQASVPCGFGNTLGNKGGVGIAFNVGKTAMLFMNAHLAAHQWRVDDRNRDYARIEQNMPLVPSGYGLEARLHAEAALAALITRSAKTQQGDAQPQAQADDSDDDEEPSPVISNGAGAVASKVEPDGLAPGEVLDTSVPTSVSERFDRIVFMGDFNYRIDATREAVDEWLQASNYEVWG
jgi:hypothetical protein